VRPGRKKLKKPKSERNFPQENLNRSSFLVSFGKQEKTLEDAGNFQLFPSGKM
jgi:hypothetical protein